MVPQKLIGAMFWPTFGGGTRVVSGFSSNFSICNWKSSLSRVKGDSSINTSSAEILQTHILILAEKIKFLKDQLDLYKLSCPNFGISLHLIHTHPTPHPSTLCATSLAS